MAKLNVNFAYTCDSNETMCPHRNYYNGCQNNQTRLNDGKTVVSLSSLEESFFLPVNDVFCATSKMEIQSVNDAIGRLGEQGPVTGDGSVFGLTVGVVVGIYP